MLLRDLPVSDLMVLDVLTLNADQNVRDAMRLFVEWDVDGAPVVDDDGAVIGMLTSGDLIVEEARLHFPTIVNFLGVNVALPWHDKELDESVNKALGETVGEVMTADPVTVGPDASIEDGATLMHDHQVSRVPVVDDDGELVGLLTRGDIMRAMVLGLDDPDFDETDDPGDDEDEDDEFTEMLEARADSDAGAEAEAEDARDAPAEGSDTDTDTDTDSASPGGPAASTPNRA